jgi:beta-lactamase regulating signal transducer with metallopeptidase domain
VSTLSGIGSAFAAAVVIGACMLASPIPGHLPGLLLPISVVTASTLSALAVLIVRRAYRHVRLHRELLRHSRKVTVDGIEIEELTGVEGAFVAGLLRPHIFCSQGLDLEFPPEEVQAILLHERYHQLDRAPAKLVPLDAMAPLVAGLRVGQVWLTRRIAALEIAADQYALRHGASRGALARALFRLQPADSASLVGIGFATVADLRLQALLEETPDASMLPSVGLVVSMAIAALCLTLIGIS